MEKNLDIMKPHSKRNYICQSFGPSLHQGFTIYSLIKIIAGFLEFLVKNKKICMS